jgi:hypothetical protein
MLQTSCKHDKHSFLSSWEGITICNVTVWTDLFWRWHNYHRYWTLLGYDLQEQSDGMINPREVYNWNQTPHLLGSSIIFANSVSLVFAATHQGSWTLTNIPWIWQFENIRSRIIIAQWRFDCCIMHHVPLLVVSLPGLDISGGCGGQWPWCHLPRPCPAEVALKMGALQLSYVKPCITPGTTVSVSNSWHEVASRAFEQFVHGQFVRMEFSNSDLTKFVVRAGDIQWSNLSRD